MKTMVSQIDLIFECRDYRVPLTSRNPMFEESLAERQRVIVYTKRDLGTQDKVADAQVRGLYDLHRGRDFMYLICCGIFSARK